MKMNEQCLPCLISQAVRTANLVKAENREELYREICRMKQCVSLKDLAVTGRDLIGAGMSPGKEIGEKLKELLELVIEDPELNTKDELLRRL